MGAVQCGPAVPALADQVPVPLKVTVAVLMAVAPLPVPSVSVNDPVNDVIDVGTKRTLMAHVSPGLSTRPLQLSLSTSKVAPVSVYRSGAVAVVAWFVKMMLGLAAELITVVFGNAYD